MRSTSASLAAGDATTLQPITEFGANAYARQFGNPPKRDIEQLRLEVVH